MSITKKSIFLILIILIIDQVFKIYIKTNMPLYYEKEIIGSWFRLHFTENSGMAFGMELKFKFGKLFLSIFRIIAIGGIAYYLRYLIIRKVPIGLVISISLILAGAIGNMIDSAFYGMIFSESFPGQAATMFPEGGGYAPFLHGKVVDMLYFPLIIGRYPEWFPFWGGNQFVFFRPVFNLADTSITTGVLMILVFQRKYFKDFR